jgi:hypothetical protein
MAMMSDDPETLRARAEEAVAIFRELGDRWGLADATMSLGVGIGESGDWVRARPLIQEALERFREAGDDRRLMWSTRTLAWATAMVGDRQQARVLYEDALRQARAAGNRLFASVVLGSLSWLAIQEGHVEDCRALLAESLRIKVELGDPNETATGLGHGAEALVAMGRPEAAARLIGAYDAMAEDFGGSETWVRRMRNDAVAKASASLEPAELEMALAEGRKLTAEKAIAIALEELEVIELPDVGS